MDRQRLEAAVLQELPLAVLLVDEQSRLLWANRSLLDSFSFFGATALKRSVKAVFDAPFASAIQSLLQERHNKAATRVVSGAGLPGSQADSYWKLRYLKKADGQGHYFTAEDVTSQELQSAELASLRRLQQSQHDAIANISHEMRNMVNVVSGMSQLLDEEVLPAAHRPYLAQLKNAASLLHDLSENVLSLSKIQHGHFTLKPAAFDVLDFIESLVQMTTFQLRGSSVCLEYHIAPSVSPCYVGDKTALYQVVLNLIGNAIKFTPQGTISLSVYSRPASQGGADELIFAVADTGIGMAPDQMQRLFGRFERLHDTQHPGTGLGLAITKALVSQMGGHITVQSTQGIGSRFEVSLPLPPAVAPVPAPTPAEVLACSTPLRVLVVEDSLLGRRYLESVLEQAGASYSSCSSAAEAKALAGASSFDLALIDLHLGGESGGELAIWLRTVLGLRCPIVALSGDNSEAAKQVAAAAGMSGLLSKPFAPQQIYRLLDTCAADQQSVAKDYGFSFSDPIHIPSLHSLYEGDLEQIEAMFEVFARTTPAALEQIGALAGQQAWGGLAAELHKIRPTFVMVGLPGVTALAKAAEQLIAQQAGARRIAEGCAQFQTAASVALRTIKSEWQRLTDFNKQLHHNKTSSHDTLLNC